jgi:hypothetical protein
VKKNFGFINYKHLSKKEKQHSVTIHKRSKSNVDNSMNKYDDDRENNRNNSYKIRQSTSPTLENNSFYRRSAPISISTRIKKNSLNNLIQSSTSLNSNEINNEAVVEVPIGTVKRQVESINFKSKPFETIEAIESIIDSEKVVEQKVIDNDQILIRPSSETSLNTVISTTQPIYLKQPMTITTRKISNTFERSPNRNSMPPFQTNTTATINIISPDSKRFKCESNKMNHSRQKSETTPSITTTTIQRQNCKVFQFLAQKNEEIKKENDSNNSFMKEQLHLTNDIKNDSIVPAEWTKSGGTIKLRKSINGRHQKTMSTFN